MDYLDELERLNANSSMPSSLVDRATSELRDLREAIRRIAEDAPTEAECWAIAAAAMRQRDDGR